MLLLYWLPHLNLSNEPCVKDSNDNRKNPHSVIEYWSKKQVTGNVNQMQWITRIVMERYNQHLRASTTSSAFNVQIILSAADN
jgi:hypothetical protein